MAIALLQSTHSNAGAVTTATLAFPSNVTAWSMLVCHIWNAGTGATLSASDNVNGSYHLDNVLFNTPAGVIGGICTFPNAAAGATTVTFNASGGTGQLRCVIEEYSGIAISSPLDQIQSATFNATTTPSSGNTPTTTQANELLIGATFGANTHTDTAGSGYTLDPNGNNGRPSCEYQVVSVTGAYAAVFNIGSTDGGVTLIATYKALPSGPPAYSLSSHLEF